MAEIGIVTRPSNDKSYAEPVYRFATILEPSSTFLTLFAGGIVARESPLSNTIDVGNGEYLNIPPIDYVILQLILCYHIASNRDNLDLIYFQKGSMGLILPLVFSKILGIKTCAIKTGAYYTERIEKETIVDRLLTIMQRLMFRIAHCVVVFSESEIQSVPNEDTFVAFSNYRNFNRFEKQIPFSERPVDIGFIGRFNEVKGVKHFAKAVLALVEKNPNLTIRIVGDGPQYETVERIVADHDQISLPGWVHHDEIATEYNRMQILVAPSKAEGLPTGLIEAMGCGVVVLATPVGSVGDLITDGETGFHLPDQDPDTIKREIKRLKNRSDLRLISEQAREHVLLNYSKEVAQERFIKITKSLIYGDVAGVTTEVSNSNV